MAVDEKISQLPEALTLAEDDYVPIVQASSGLNKKAKVRAFVPDPSFIENIVFLTSADVILQSNKINWVTPTVNHTILLPTANISYLGQVIVVNNKSNVYTLTVQGSTTSNIILSGENSIVGLACVTNGSGYGWEIFSMYNKSDFNNLVQDVITNGVTTIAPSQNAVFDALALKLDLSGGNANQDIDIDGFGVNAKHFKINGTGGAGHIGLKHQSADITASASESSIGANSVGDPVWKNDGGAIDKLELQSNKTSTVTGNEASTSKYLTVKGVYDWAVGLFAPKASPTFTGTVTTPDIVVSNATASTPVFFDAVDKLISTTAQLWGTWVQTWASKATPVDADTIGFHDSATTFVGVKSTLLNFWTTYLLPKIQALGYLSGTGLATNRYTYYNGTSLVTGQIGWVTSQNFFIIYRSDLSLNNCIQINSATNGMTFTEGGVQILNLGVGGLYGALGARGGVLIQSASGSFANGYIWVKPNDNEFSSTKHSFRALDNNLMMFVNAGGLCINSATQNASAILQADSTTKGFLPPRMTAAQMTAIASPATGLIVYQTDGTAGLYQYNGTAWVSFASMSGLSTNYTPYWDGTKLVNSDLYRISGAGQTGGIGTRSARLFQAMNSEANGENALGVYKLINTNIYDAQEIGSNSRGLRIYANNAPAGSASLSYYALRVDNNTTNGSYIAWLQATDKTLAEAQLTGVNSGTILIRRDGTVSSATPPVNYNTGFYFEIRPSTDTANYNKYGNFYLALIDVANKKSGFQFIVNNNKRMTLHEDGGLLIGTGAVPNASAALDVDSTTKGFLPPRMTNAQRTAIASPAIGLMVYCTDTVEGLWINKSTGWTFII